MKKTGLALLSIILVFAAGIPLSAQTLRTAAPTTFGIQNRFVEFEKIDAFTSGQGVLIRWEMRTETQNAGFNIFRVTPSGLEPVNDYLVIGGAFRKPNDNVVTGGTYEWFDGEGTFGTVYVIQALAVEGQTQLSSRFASRYVTDFEAQAGYPLSVYQGLASNPNRNIQKRDLELTPDLQATVQANLQQPDLETHLWVVGQPAAKIGIKQDGFYRVTRAQLETAGFNVNSDSANWRLFHEGVEQAITVGPADEYVEFYGRGLDRVESDTRMYYLIADTQAGSRISTKVLRPIGGTVVANNYRVTAYKKERQAPFIKEIQNGPDVENYWGRPIGATPMSFTFNMSGLDQSVSRYVLKVNLQGQVGATHKVKAVFNGHELGNIIATGTTVAYSGEFLLPTSFFVEGVNTLVLNELEQNRFSLFESISTRYTRKYQVEQDQLSFYTPGFRKVDLTGFTTSNFRLFDMTFDGNPIEVINSTVVENAGVFTVKLPSTRAMVMYALTDAHLLEPASVTANTPSDLHGPNAADMLIISHSAVDFMTAAENWATYRRSAEGGNFNVKVIDVEDIIDEFGYGVSSATAIRNFLQFSHDEAGPWTTHPAYVLLIGDASHDPRNYEGLGKWNLIPTRMLNLIFEETGSDEAMGDFDLPGRPHDGVAEMAIGRIPVRTAAPITTILNKTMAFETREMQSLEDRGAAFAFDVPNPGVFRDMSVELRDQLPAAVPTTMISRGLLNQGTQSDPAAPGLLLNTINSGKHIVNYAGHGSPGVWGSAQFFGLATVPQLTNANTQSIFTMLTCFNGYFYWSTGDSLGEALLKAPNGGAVASWASATETTSGIQLQMGKRFYKELGLANIPRMGDLVRDAKNEIAGSDVGYSWALLGDPALKVR